MSLRSGVDDASLEGSFVNASILSLWRSIPSCIEVRFANLCHLLTFSPFLSHHSRFLPSAPSPEADATEPICILIDSISLTLLRGSTIDYVTELIGSQFAIKDNPQAKGAGCGCGVSWEPKV